jgi:hypothetical protein
MNLSATQRNTNAQKAKQLDRSYTRWEVIDSDKWIQTHQEFTHKLRNLLDRSDYLDAEAYLNEIKQYGVRPNPAIYQELVRVYSLKDDIDSVNKLIAELNEKKVKPSQFVFDRLIHLHARHKNKDGIKQTLKQMEDYDMEPNPNTFTEIIAAYASVGDEGAALRTFEHVKKVFGHANTVQYAEVILMLAKHHDWLNIKTVWGDFKESHQKPDALLLNLLFDCGQKMGDKEFVEEISATMKKYNVEEHASHYHLTETY